MPNWCENKLTVRGPSKNIQQFKEKAVGHCPWETPAEGEKPSPLNFHSLVPVPDEVLKTGEDSAEDEWQIEHWGCQSSAEDVKLFDGDKSRLDYTFLTPWLPPIPFVETVARDWPNLTFILAYDEPGMRFKGLGKFEGEKSEQLEFDY